MAAHIGGRGELRGSRQETHGWKLQFLVSSMENLLSLTFLLPRNNHPFSLERTKLCTPDLGIALVVVFHWAVASQREYSNTIDHHVERLVLFSPPE
jgi:hypothetical protein